MYMSGEKIHTKRKGVWRMEYEADSKKQVVMPWRSSIQSVFVVRSEIGQEEIQRESLGESKNKFRYIFIYF